MVSPTIPDDAAIFWLDAADLYRMIGAGFARLKAHSHIVDALNVYPVPDGDTGGNMTLTLQAAWDSASAALSDRTGEVMQALANGAMRGARGNSGVILSQIFRGMAEGMRGAEKIDAQILAKALELGRDTAYKGVQKPVEGTILTVIREAAEAAGHAAAINPDLRFVLGAAVERGQHALAQTPELLPVLKQAGVVDAGGQGLCYLLEGMLDYLQGKPYAQPEEVSAIEATPAPQPDLEALAEEEWGYDIQYLIYGQGLDEERIREGLLALGGDSVVVGRAGDVIKVHVHGKDPGPFLSYGASLGQLDDIVLENMTLQALRRRGREPDSLSDLARPPRPAPEAHATAPSAPAECYGVVAVVAGEGMRKVFERLGVCAIVTGGQSMNPSAQEIAQAAESLPHEEVIVLPNNKNVILAARQAAALSKKRIHVIETRSMAQGAAAMLGYHPDADVETNVALMTAAARDVYTAEVTTAVREARFDHVRVNPGDIIGLVDGRLCCAGKDLFTVLKDVLTQIDPDDMTEIFTLYYGESVSEAEAQALVERLKPHFEDHKFELVYGGQPHYHFIISAE